MEQTESRTSRFSNCVESETPSYFDFVSPSVVTDTSIREGEKYQEYVDRMVEVFPTVWQKNILSYCALALPVVTLYGSAIHNPSSVEPLGIFDTTMIEQEQKKGSLPVNSYSSSKEVQEALDGRCVKLTPDYRTKLLSQGLLCIHGFSELKREIEKKGEEKFLEKESIEKKKLSNILLGSYGEKEAALLKYRHLELERAIGGQLNYNIGKFKEANSYFTEKEVINYGDIWGIASGELQNVAHQIGIPRRVLNNMLDLQKTLLNS